MRLEVFIMKIRLIIQNFDLTYNELSTYVSDIKPSVAEYIKVGNKIYEVDKIGINLDKDECIVLCKYVVTNDGDFF